MLNYALKLLGITLLSIGTLSAQGIPKTMLRLPDSGQTQSFTNTFGEDADYIIHPPGFILHGDGTATDTVTGLMWQQTDGGEMTFEAAQTWVAQLSLAGFDDWRLPTAQEAFCLLNHSKNNPAVDGAVFTNTGAEYWWTSETQIGNANKIWVTNAGGGIGNHLKTETVSAGGSKKFHARAVRQVQPITLVDNQFVSTDSTVADALTGLEWQRFVFPDSITWEDALVYAQNLVLNGKNDWRLPNIKELQSINDETRSQPSVNKEAFQGISVAQYWSSTSLPNQPVRAWYLDTRFGIVTYEPKTARNNFICVRGGESGVSATTEVLIRQPQVFPNPFRTTFQLTNTGNAVCCLYNQMGQLHYCGNAPGEQNFSTLPPGIYFLTISGSIPTVLKLVKI